MLRTKLTLISAAILLSTVAHAGSITVGGGTATSNSASVSGGAAGAFTIGTGLHGATTTDASAGNAMSGTVVSPSSVVTQSTTASTSQNTSLSGGVGFGASGAGRISDSTTGAGATGHMNTLLWVFP